MSCQSLSAPLDICPTADEITPQLIALLPRGRAWGTHDGGPFPGTVLWRFWYAVATVLAFFNARACALLLEYFCRTATETHDTWLLEYGLPDGCDPFPDLCTKVAAIGGTRCDYYRAVAAQAGWSITCTDLNDACGSKAGNAYAGCSMAGRGLPPKVLLITVLLPDSPAHVGGSPAPSNPGASARTSAGLAPPFAGRLEAGGLLSCPGTGDVAVLATCDVGIPLAGALFSGARLGCPPDLSTLECLLARIVAADVHLIYEISQ